MDCLWQSIDYLLDFSELTINDIDWIVCGMVTSATPDELVLRKLFRDIVDGVSSNPDLKEKYYERLISEIEWNRNHLEEIVNWAKSESVQDRLVFIDHHLSHAAGAYYTSPFEESMVFTCDGKGNFQCSSVSKGTTHKLELLDSQTTFDSVGYFYGNITKALGFRPERHEGKVTGLAAYGDSNRFLHITNEILRFESGRIKTKIGNYYLPWFVGEQDLPEFYAVVRKHKKEDVAAAAQETLENVITGWIDQSIIKYSGNSPTNVCLSGGVFANVKLNQKIRELEKVKNVYIQPAMGDMGIPLGSCLAQMANNDTPFKRFVPSMALGPSLNANVKQILLKRNYKFWSCNSVEEDIGKLIDSGKVVGYCEGRMEFGPRALCHRSILYHCRDKEANHWLNKRLNRTDFMPFAPVTTEELAERCFIGWHEDDRSADFMTMTYNVTKEFIEKCPAAVHVDNTARPQIIRKKSNPQMHSIITHYHHKTGDLALINTSLNNHEEPIVCTIDDALNALRMNNIDVLFVEKLIVYG